MRSTRRFLAMRSTFRSMAVRDFRIFVTGHTVSQMGTWMQRLAVIWAVFEITDSGTAVGVASACVFGPAIVLSPLAGLVADRRESRSLLVTTKIGLVISAAVLAAVAFSHPSTPTPYLLAALLFGVVETFDIPVRMIFVGALVDREDLSNAIGLNSSAMNGSRIVGPALGGALISGAGVEWCFAVNIALATIVLVSMLTIRTRSQPDPAPTPDRRMLLGFGVAWREPVLRASLLAYTVVGVFAIVFPVTLPLFAERTLGGGPETFTLLFATLSLGAIGGGLVVARRAMPGLGFLGASSIATALTMAALAATNSVVAAALAAVTVGAATMAFMGAVVTVVQLNAPTATRGRVLALVSMVGIGSRAVGGPILGTIIDAINARASLFLGAAVSAIVGAWLLLSTRRARTRVPIRSASNPDDRLS